MSELAAVLASFATPTRGLVVPSAEGRRLGSLISIPTAERKRRAIAALIVDAQKRGGRA